jgi:hypothetical protein
MWTYLPFNSLSRDHLVEARILLEDIVESFNSLSRDHGGERVMPRHYVKKPRNILSTPSLGITAEALVFTIRASDELILSTPSLGITEPDSGIFRLSAAFCRGAPSHK